MTKTKKPPVPMTECRNCQKEIPFHGSTHIKTNKGPNYYLCDECTIKAFPEISIRKEA